MKRKLIPVLLACGASVLLGTAYADVATPAPTPDSSPVEDAGPHHGDHLLKHLTYALGLTGSQQAEIAPILEAAKPQLKAIHQQAKTDRDSVFSSVSSQITPLLTGTQQAKFAEIIQRLEAGPGPGQGEGKQFRHGPHGDGGGRGGDQLAHLTTALGLTTDQQAQIKPILDAAHTQVKATFQNSSLTQEQKMTQVKSTLEAANSQINGILTPAQQAQFATLKQQWHHHHGQGGDSSANASATPAGQ